MFADKLTRRSLATPAAARNRQLSLDLTERGGALLDRRANLAIGDTVTNTDIHRKPFD